MVIFFQQNHFLLFWLLYLAGIAGISVLSFVKWSGHGAMGRFWVPVDWIKSFFVVSIAYLLFRRFYSEKTACRFTIFFFSAAMLLLVISFFIRLEKRNSGCYDYTTSDTSYLVGERGYMAQWEAAKKVSSLVSQNQLVAVGPRYDNIYWRVWGNFNSRRISDQNIAEIEEKEKSCLLWGFVVVDPEDFIKGFDEETQQKLIIPLLENPEQFPQYKVIPLSPVITAYQYIGDNP